MVSVVAKTKLYPTEDPEKVRQALLNIFPGAYLQEAEGEVVAMTEDLGHFMEQVRRQRILDATRTVLIHAIQGSSTQLHLNKQVAFVGKITVMEGKSPLGDIDVTFEDDDIQALIDRITPRTVDGEEV
jgi:predicted RNA binding protein with dsRBD fold (UPF0201 family)